MKNQKKKIKFYIEVSFLKLYYEFKIKKNFKNYIKNTNDKILKNNFIIKYCKKKKKKNLKIKFYYIQKHICKLFFLILKFRSQQRFNITFFYSRLNLKYESNLKIKKIKNLIIDSMINPKKKCKYVKKFKNRLIFNFEDFSDFGKIKFSNKYRGRICIKIFCKFLNRINRKNIHSIYHNIIRIDEKNKQTIETSVQVDFSYKFVLLKSFFSCSRHIYMSIKINNFFLRNYFIFYNKILKSFFKKKKFLFSLDLLRITNKYICINGMRYIKLCLIGKGGSCKVYKIMDENKKLFALKRTKILNFGIGTLHNCINEISILKILKNRNKIIQLKNADICLSKGVLHLVFEYGECDLENFINNNNNLPKIKLLRVLWKQMLEAIYTLHEERIIHGDIKPSNFLLINNSLKIIDFGISKPIQKNTTNITRDIQVGTINYMSPEAILYIPQLECNYKKIKISRSSDIWSVGCILFQMVYGNPPFYHLPFMKKIQAIVSKNFEIFLLPIRNTSLKDVLKNCLIRNPNLRPTIPELILHPFLFKQDTIIQNFLKLK